jgi:pimeloyl-ACP methyl ester carboxylesterase
VLVCGHSTGGAIVLQLAVSHPATAAGLLLVDTGAHVAHGRHDRARPPPEQGRELAAGLPDAEFRRAESQRVYGLIRPGWRAIIWSKNSRRPGPAASRRSLSPR